MLKAVDLGVTTLEMDVCFTSDHKAVLSHEPYFNHDITTKPDGSFITSEEEKNYNIYKMQYDEVVKYDVGMKPNPRFPRQTKMKAVKPLLEEVIDSVEGYVRNKNLPPVLYNIETKTKSSTDNTFHPEPETFVDLLMEIIKRKNLESKVTIQSFDIRTLKHLHKKYPGIATALLIEKSDGQTSEQKVNSLGFVPTILSPEFLMVSPALVEFAHSKGMKVIPWTVNNKMLIEALKNMKVNGIITDYPDLFE